MVEQTKSTRDTLATNTHNITPLQNYINRNKLNRQHQPLLQNQNMVQRTSNIRNYAYKKTTSLPRLNMQDMQQRNRYRPPRIYVQNKQIIPERKTDNILNRKMRGKGRRQETEWKHQRKMGKDL